YGNLGVCPPHMDSPEAKWTLDLCVGQSTPWPIYFSQVCPWPESASDTWRDGDWEEQIKRSPSLRFTSYTLEPGQAVVFSGSSQWHYRDAIPAGRGRKFAELLFFHFVPKGSAALLRPEPRPRRVLPEEHERGHERPDQQLVGDVEHAAAPAEQPLCQRPSGVPWTDRVEEVVGHGRTEQRASLAQRQVDHRREMSVLDADDERRPRQHVAMPVDEQRDIDKRLQRRETILGGVERQVDELVRERHAPDGMPLPARRRCRRPDRLHVQPRGVSLSQVAMQLHVDAARGKDRVVLRALLLIGSPRVSQRFER